MAIRDLSNLPRAEVDALRREIGAAFLPGGDFNRGLLAQRRLREIIDAQPITTVDKRTTSWLNPKRRIGGRVRGSKVVNGRVVPPPVTVPLDGRVALAPLPPHVEAKMLASEDRIRDWWRQRLP